MTETFPKIIWSRKYDSKYVNIVWKKGKLKFENPLYLPFEKEIVINSKTCTFDQFVLHIRQMIQTAKQFKYFYIGFDYENILNFPLLKNQKIQMLRILFTQIVISSYSFDTLKKNKESIKEIAFFGKILKTEQKVMESEIILGESINQARELINTSSNRLSAENFTAKVRELISKEDKCSVEVFDENEAKKRNFNLFLAVNQGSHRKPQFITVKYFGATSEKRKPFVFVGKGVTFDTGGLNLKPSGAASLITMMHMDMTGAALAFGTILALAKMKVKANVIAVLPMVENAISDKSIRPGDIVTSHKGDSVYIGNTDAEGRLILADALSYATKFNPASVFDVATLCGSTRIALGTFATAVFSRNETLLSELKNIGSSVLNPVWPLPLGDEHVNAMKHPLADISNMQRMYNGGQSSTAAAFLENFTKKYKKNTEWAHFDVVSRRVSSPKDFLAQGSLGEPISLFVKYVQQKTQRSK